MVFFAPNPYDGGQPFAVPFDYTITACEAAEAFPPPELEDYLATQGDVFNPIDRPLPEDLVTKIVGEHGSAAPYTPTAAGKAGELGLYQIDRPERREFNRKTGSKATPETLLDPLGSADVAAFVIWDDKETHRTAHRCIRKQPAGTRVDEETGALVVTYAVPKHHWIAHFKCGGSYREQCPTGRRERFLKRFRRYRLAAETMASWPDHFTSLGLFRSTLLSSSAW